MNLSTWRLLALAIALAGAAGPAGSANAVPAMPLHVATFVQADAFIGKDWRAIARYVDWINVTRPSEFNRISAAGIKTIWYQDPHRICTRSGVCSDRPPASELDDRSFLRCSSGARLQSSYSPSTDTYFSDPSSKELIRRTNAYTEDIIKSGHLDYVWIDDAHLPAESSPERWNCGPGNWTFANGTPYTDAAFANAMEQLHAALLRPAIIEGLCNSDGSRSALGAGAPTDPAGITRIVAGSNVAGAMCENFAEGWGTRNHGKASGSVWISHMNTALQVQSYGKMFVAYPYFGNNGCCGPADPIDQRGYFYASFMLVYDPKLSVMKFSTWGGGVRSTSNFGVQPEAMLVPTRPLRTASWDRGKIDALKTGNVYAREFGACYLFGKLVGPCAALVNPDARIGYALPSLAQQYGHAAVLRGFGILSGANGTPNAGDDGSLVVDGPLPTSIPPQGSAILFR